MLFKSHNKVPGDPKAQKEISLTSKLSILTPNNGTLQGSHVSWRLSPIIINGTSFI